jgi:hypothetical protein
MMNRTDYQNESHFKPTTIVHQKRATRLIKRILIECYNEQQTQYLTHSSPQNKRIAYTATSNDNESSLINKETNHQKGDEQNHTHEGRKIELGSETNVIIQ